MINNLQKFLRLKIELARAGLLWEQIWQALFWPIMIVGLGLLAVFSGIVAVLPYSGRLAVLAIFSLVLIYSLRHLLTIKWPDQRQGLNRVEDRSNLAHRPATAWVDDLADKSVDGRSQIIWQAHKKRQYEKISKLKAGYPQSNWIKFDHGGWRFTLAMLLLVSVVLTGGDWRGQLSQAVLGEKPVVPVKVVGIDAWISPPTFMQKAPILLTSTAKIAAIKNGQPIIAPEGSVLRVRVNGVAQFTLVISAQGVAGGKGGMLKTFDVQASGESNVLDKKYLLQRPVHVSVVFEDKQQTSWNIGLLADTAPLVILDQGISTTPTGGFSVPWSASDDYGIASLHGQIALAATIEKNRQKKSSGGPLVYKAPNFSISLPSIAPKKAKGKAFQDLTAHPWAGQKVKLVVVAKDQAGQTGKSTQIEFVLPERRFSKPLAQVLIEQRRRLVGSPDQKKQVVKVIAMLMAWPQGLTEKSGNYLGLRTLGRLLHRAKNRVEIKHVVAEMWKLALQIEDGDLSATRKALEAARKALQKALAKGASQKEISRLTQNLKKALNEHMAALQRQMQQALSKNQSLQDGLQNQGREIRARDLQKMMENIENLAKSGANDAAQELLSQLENILKNLNPGLAQKPMAPQRTPPGAKMLDEIAKMMREQRKLMDKTFKLPDEKRDYRNQRERRRQNGRGEKKPGNKLGNQLGTQQERLKNLLGQMMQQMKDGGLKTPRALEQARRAMRRASKALKDGQKGSALGMQGNAMQGLRKGAETMAKELMAKGKGDEGNFGKHSETEARKNDPLGRPMPRAGSDFGPNENIIPKESQILKAQDIMRSLRERSNDRARPKYELQYLDRLLKGLF